MSPADTSEILLKLKDRPFSPHRWFQGGHLQTLAASQWQREFPWGWSRQRREVIELRDGSHLQLVIIERDPSAPTLLAFHGMGGSSSSGYMLGLSHKAFYEGWNSALVSLYNLNHKLSHPKIFHAGCSREAEEIVDQVLKKLNSKHLFLAGVSMGGNILLKLLGEWGNRYPGEVKAAAAISPLVDLTASWPVLDRPANRIYRWYFIKRLRRVAQNQADHLGRFLDLRNLMQIKTIREFDDLVTAPLSGFEGALDYYRQCSAINHLSEIRIPTFLLHSKDDPLLPWQPLQVEAAKENPALLVHLTESGGHVGFIQNKPVDGLDRAWAENRVIDYFRTLFS